MFMTIRCFHFSEEVLIFPFAKPHIDKAARPSMLYTITKTKKKLKNGVSKSVGVARGGVTQGNKLTPSFLFQSANRPSLLRTAKANILPAAQE